MILSLVTKIVFGLSIVGLAIQSVQAADDSSKSMQITAHKKNLHEISREETAAEKRAAVRFLTHLSTDPIEIARQAVGSDSLAWMHFGDVLRFGTIAHNLYELYENPLCLTGERLCELAHYVGDFGERYAIYVDYTGGWRTAMNVRWGSGLCWY
jgi:hypothetical protein